jgi:apolipoprotein N-acyltransferase
MEQTFYERHLALTGAEPRADVTIWSEAAVPFLLDGSPDLLADSAAAAAPGRLILGIRRTEDGRWYNSLAVLGREGRPEAVYDKYRLVPFGEYIPLAPLVARLGLPALETLTRSGFSPGDGPHLVQAPGLPPFLPLICYEAIFPQGLHAPEGRGEWLVQLTNDAWFGEASGPYQHLAQARIRAIEQGLPIARIANTGITAMVDPYGRVVAKLGIGEVGAVDTTLPGFLPLTVYGRLGDSFSLTASVTLLGLTVINFYSRNRSRIRR